jgi:hypothetical protein
MRAKTLHRSTVVVAFGMLALVTLLNVPGDNLSPLGHPVLSTYRAEYLHGWPWVSLYRTVFYDFAAPQATTFPDAPKYGVPWLARTNWEFWQGNPWKLHPAAVMGNLVVGALLIVLVAAAWELRRRRRTRWLQFTLREVAIAMTVVAAAFGWWQYERAGYHYEDDLNQIDGGYVTLDQVYKGPLWLKRLVGEDLLHDVCYRAEAVTLEIIDDTDFHQAVAVFRGLPYLRQIELSPSMLSSVRSKIPPFPFSKLAQLTNIKTLVLHDFSLTTDDVKELAALHQLENLCITNWDSQDPAIIQRLIGALPDCHIMENPPADSYDE